MKIGLNLLFMIPGQVGGTEVFVRNIVETLSKIDNKNTYVLYLNQENSNYFGKLPKNFIKVVCKFNAVKRFKRIIWEQLVLPVQCYRDRIDVLHSLGYTSPLITHCPKITTIYDLNYHYFPEDFSILNLLVFKIMIPLVAFFSNIVMVHSYKTKKDMHNVLGIDNKKIKVVYGGVSEIFKKKMTSTDVIKTINKYGIKKPFVFSAARSDPHKNLKSLVYAYDYLIHKYKIKQKLVLLGFHGRGQSELDKILEKPELKNNVTFTGWVDPIDMPAFYKASDMFVFPSLYEGFGLPLVESMAAGVPLVTSNASCIPEVVGDGGLIVDTKNYKKMGEAMYKVLKSKTFRNTLIKRGIKKSQRYSWDDLVRFNIKLYESQTSK